MIKWKRFDTGSKNESAIFSSWISFTGHFKVIHFSIQMSSQSSIWKMTTHANKTGHNLKTSSSITIL